MAPARDPRQPQLPLDPMPSRVEPCLALLASQPPIGRDWSFEVKWDGYRLAVHVEPQGVRILTRGGHDWTHRFPGIAAAAKALDVSTLILDGEAVVLDAEGRSDFGALQQALGGRSGKRAAGEALLYAFDLLYLDGMDLTGMALAERRHLLESLLSGQTGEVRLSEEIEADGAALLKIACQHGLEGIIAKHRDRPYRSGRQGDWVKIKCVRSESFAVIGYEPSTAMRGAIASLLLAARRGKDLVFVGSVGTGFSQDAARALKVRLDTLEISAPAATLPADASNRLVFARPDLVAEIEFRAWTSDGRLRHAAFKGLRDAADVGAVLEI
ncbi:non-homologous end-joining DNA ligase [Aureimonas sp. SA4125]|uniref:non-homologous end-joining DNA ligase n=1 Tax=Aureimonas sp. SA4125 TaxID=2826993 RepID=UPI001CC6B7C0|nr:non-homologous end-joining DNA ligase [Aureimonas sp. SA4125]